MNLSFIKLDINIMNDAKIKLIRKMPDGDSILVLWIGILCLGMKSGRVGTLDLGDGIPFTAETLSIELDIPINTVRLGLKAFQDFKMIEIWDDGTTFLRNFEKHQAIAKIECAKEKSRISSQKHRKKVAMLSDGHVTDSDHTDKEEDKEEEIDTQAQIEFDIFWETYGKKKDRKKCFLKYKKLKASDRIRITETLPGYILSTPDKIFRKHPLTYLNGECWNDEPDSRSLNGGQGLSEYEKALGAGRVLNG